MPNLHFKDDDNIIILNKNDENIKKKIFKEFTEFTFKKSINFYYSNLKIYNSSDLKNGFFLKPIQIKDMIIGFHHFEDKEIDNKKVLSNLNFSFKINDNNLKIIENGIDEVLDFCSEANIRLCSSEKDFYLKKDNYIGMVIHNSYIHYVIINKNESNIKGMLIHRSKNPITYPINLCIINKKQDNILNDITWLSSDLKNITNMPWSLELEDKKTYDKRKIPKKEPLNRDYGNITEAPVFTERDPFFDLPKWSKRIEIIEATRNNDIINLKLKFHNINQLYLNNMYLIKVKVWNNDEDNNKLNIPLKNKLILENKIVNNVTVDISNYGNIFYKNKIKVQVIGLISEFAQDKFNMNSNVVSL